MPLAKYVKQLFANRDVGGSILDFFFIFFFHFYVKFEGNFTQITILMKKIEKKIGIKNDHFQTYRTLLKVKISKQLQQKSSLFMKTTPKIFFSIISVH